MLSLGDFRMAKKSKNQIKREKAGTEPVAQDVHMRRLDQLESSARRVQAVCEQRNETLPGYARKTTKIKKIRRKLRAAWKTAQDASAPRKVAA